MADKEDWYSRNGVSPPESISHGLEEDISAKLSGTVHGAWIQRGRTLICMKCPQHHATEAIPVNKILIGTDENGLPILTTIGSKRHNELYKRRPSFGEPERGQ